MDRVPQYALTGGALIMGALLAYGAFGVTHHLIVTIDKVGDAAAGASVVLGQTSNTLSKVNGKFGTLQEAEKALVLAKRLLGHADIAAEHYDRQLRTYDRYAQRMVGDVDRVSRSLAGTSDAATESLHSVTRAVGTANTTAAAIRPVLEDSRGMIEDYRAELPYFHRIIVASATTSEQVAGTTTSINKMAATAEKKIDAKPTIKGRILEYGGPIVKILAWFAK